jgi:4-amino-4-deoxy-L-arabinose transferase-like glycosyltransferase
MAVAVLTKGLIGLVLPVLVMGLWIVFFQEWRLLRVFEIACYLAVFALIAVPWHFLVSLQNPEFLHFYFVEHHFSRFSSGDVGHLRPFWYYIPVVLLGLFPWVVFLPQTFLHAWRKYHDKKIEYFFMMYALVILIFFSISKAKLIPYVLPIFPPLAILIARFLRQAPTLQRSYGVLVFFGSVLSAGCLLFTKYWQVFDLNSTNNYLRIAACILIVGSILGYYFSRKNRHLALISTIVMGGLLGIILMAALPKMDRLTIFPLTQILKPQLKNEDEVVAFNHHFQDLSFYLERRVNILNSRKLFAFGMAHQQNHDWMMDDKKFNEDWLSAKRVFAVMDIEQYQKIPERYQHLNFYLWGKTSKNVLVSNVPLNH